MITDEQLETVARQDIAQAIDSFCLGAAEQSEVLYDKFPEEFCTQDSVDGLIERYDRIVRRVRDDLFPPTGM